MRAGAVRAAAGSLPVLILAALGACTSLPPWGDDPVAIQRANVAASAPRVSGASAPAVRAEPPAVGTPAASDARAAAPPTAAPQTAVPQDAAGRIAYTLPVQNPPLRATSDPAIVALRSRLVEGAQSILGRTALNVRGRTFTMDCTGVVLAVYWYAGMDLARDFGSQSPDLLFNGNHIVLDKPADRGLHHLLFIG